MEGQEGFNFIIGPCRANLEVLGIWPDIYRKELNSLKCNLKVFLAIFFMGVFCIIPQTTKLILVWGNLEQMTDIISTGDLPFFVSITKVVVLYYNKKVLLSVLILIWNCWNKPRNSQELKIMTKTAKTSRKLGMICATVAHSAFTFYMLIRLYIAAVSKFKAENLIFFNSYFPRQLLKSPYAEVLWLAQYIGGLYGIFAYAGVDALFIMLISHLCGQLRHLAWEIKNLESHPDEKKIMEKHIEMKVVQIVVRHVQIIKLAETVENMFSMMCLTQVGSFLIQFCMQGFQFVSLLISDDATLFQAAFMMSFMTYILTSLLLYCYITEVLVTESTSLAFAVYDTRWYNLSPGSIRSMIMIMAYSSQPLRITGGKFVAFSLPLFARVLKTSMGYISVLLAMKSKQF